MNEQSIEMKIDLLTANYVQITRYNILQEQIPNGFRMKSQYKFCKILNAERESDQCFVALISLQQQKHFIAVKALLDLASGGSTDLNEAHTYHYGRNAKLSKTKLF